MRALLKTLKYLWASPATLIGLFAVGIGCITGARIQIARGAIEVHGGLVTKFLRHGLPLLGAGAAMTLGHVILGRDIECLDDCRNHEHVHVRQYERWGPFFLPAYILASLYLWVRGRDPYLDNPFEKEAYELEP
jgi:hypothetical protein